VRTYHHLEPEAIRALFGYGELPNFRRAITWRRTQPIPCCASTTATLVRADALGLLAVLGQGSENVPLSSMRAANPCSISLPFATPCAAALSHPDRRLYEWQHRKLPPSAVFRARQTRADGTAPPLAFAGLRNRPANARSRYRCHHPPRRNRTLTPS